MRLFAAILVLALPLYAQGPTTAGPSGQPTPTPAPAVEPGISPELAKLQAEAERLEAELERERQILAAKAEVERLRQELRDAKRGKMPDAPAKPRGKPVLRPEHLPAIGMGEAIVLQDADGIWWAYERRPWTGVISLVEFGAEDDAKPAAEEWAANQRRQWRQYMAGR